MKHHVSMWMGMDDRTSKDIPYMNVHDLKPIITD